MSAITVDLSEKNAALVRSLVESGRFETVGAVLDEALARMAEDEARLEALKAHLAEGIAEADRGEFVEDFSVEDIISELDARSAAKFR